MAAHYNNHLTINGTNYNTVWLDAMHDRTNYKANAATVDEDNLMTISRMWPQTSFTTPQPVNFLTLFKQKYILEPKINVINAIPGEMRIKDVYSGMFFGFALNEFIDQADTSTLNYLKYYDSLGTTTNIELNFAGSSGLPPESFPNSFLYNCDKILFKYFIEQKDGSDTSLYHYDNTDDTENSVWSTDNCKKRHLYNLNCFWKKLLDTIDSDHADDDVYNFENVIKTAAIVCLRQIVFTDFKMMKNTTGARNAYVDFLYQYPMWKINNAGVEYYYVTTQSLCASNIPNKNVNVKPRPEGKTTKEQKSCFKGLRKLLDNSNANHLIKSHFYMLLKYAGDTSHMVLYDILNTITNIDKPNLALYLSERPLLVRAFAKNMNIYCKYLAKFNQISIIKTPDEVFKLTNMKDNVIRLTRAKNYIEDIVKLQSIIQPPPPPNLDILFLNVELPDIDNLITSAMTNEAITLDPTDHIKVESYHNFIKQIIACHELIGKTTTFIKHMEHVNRTIINRKFFPTKSRCPLLTDLTSFLSDMVNKAINQKNKEQFYRALEYLHTFNSITLPAIDNTLIPTATDLYNYFKDLRILLENTIFQNKNKFEKLNPISINEGSAGRPIAVQIRHMINEPHKLREWIDSEFNRASSRSNKLTDIGIQNIVDYLIMYDTLTHNVSDDGVALVGGSAFVAHLSAPAPADFGFNLTLLDLDSTLKEQEIENIIKELKINVGIDIGRIKVLYKGLVDDIDALNNNGNITMYVTKITNDIDALLNYLDVTTYSDGNVDLIEALILILNEIKDFNEEIIPFVVEMNKEQIDAVVIANNVVEEKEKKILEFLDTMDNDDNSLVDDDISLVDDDISLVGKELYDEVIRVIVVAEKMLTTMWRVEANASAAAAVVDTAAVVAAARRSAAAAAAAVENKDVVTKRDRDRSPDRRSLSVNYGEERVKNAKRFAEERGAARTLSFTYNDGGGRKTRKKSKSSQLRKTIKKRRVKKIKRKSLRRRKPIKKRVNSKNRKVKRKIKNKTRKYKNPKKQKRSRKPKP